MQRLGSVRVRHEGLEAGIDRVSFQHGLEEYSQGFVFKEQVGDAGGSIAV